MPFLTICLLFFILLCRHTYINSNVSNGIIELGIGRSRSVLREGEKAMVSALYEFDGHKQTVALQTCRLQESASQTAEPHVALHFHGAVEFLFVENGRYRAWVDGNTCTLRKGDILFVDSHLPHSYSVPRSRTVSLP